MWTDPIGPIDGRNEDGPTLKEIRARDAGQPKNDEEKHYFKELQLEAWKQTASRKDKEVGEMMGNADIGKKVKTQRMKGTESTRAKAAERIKEIRKAYADIKRKLPEEKREYYIAKTIEIFKGKRKRPRQNYGLRTVEKVTKGL